MSQPFVHPSELPRLGTLECDVMDALWDHGAGSVRDVINRLPTALAYTTIATVLRNLGRKGMVTVTRERHSTRYAARISREEHAAELMAQVLQTSGNRSASMLHFLQSIAEDDLALLRDYLNGNDAEPTS